MHELGRLVVAGMLSITFRRGFRGPLQTRFERPGNRFNRFNRFNRCELKRADAGGLPASGTSAKRSTTAKSAKTAIFAMAAIMTILPLSLPGQAANANPTALIETSFGKIELELLPKFAPKHVAQFLNLINAGFYDGLTFHRVIANFMIQGGGYDANLTYRPVPATVTNESFNGLKNRRGTVAMARLDDPDSGDSQFFINVRDNFQLDAADGEPGYTVFARVQGGMEVVESIELVDTVLRRGMAGVPAQPVIIQRITCAGTPRCNVTFDASK